jgi:SAM-dependent methyltransferase
MDWKDGYVAEIEYVHSFHPGLGPSSLNFVLMMNGMEPVPLHHGFSYCELGCGQGESLNLLSACHPEGRFHAIDFNHAHIEAARGRALKANLANSTFWEADFADLDELPLPEFDFIALHGVYSWVNEEKRQHIVKFIRHRLKPGGVVYSSYNSLPGWAAHAPLRQLLASHADTQSGPLSERIDHSVRFVEQLKGLDLAYFSTNPSSSSLFDTISALPRNYLAHEFFNRDWTLFYHSDVVKEFAQADLTFAGSARFIDFKDSLRFPAPVLQLLNELRDPVMRETVKDFAVNQQFRSDIFTKGRPRFPESEQMEHLLNCRFILVVPRGDGSLEVRFPVGMKRLLPELYDPILCALEEESQSLEELFLRPEIALFEAAQVVEALIVLRAAEYILPAVEPSPEALASTRLYNLSILERVFSTSERQFLASPLLQSGIPLDWPQLLLLLCEVTKADEPLAFAWDYMRANDYKLTKDGAVLQSEEENFAELCIMAERFRTDQVPMLRRLCVI